MKNKYHTKVKNKTKKLLWKRKTVGHLMNFQENDTNGLCLSI